MRNPLRKTAYCFVLALLGAAGVLLATVAKDRLGDTVGTIAGILGLPVLVFSLFFFLLSLFAAIGHARLASGIGVIARWHVTAAEWDRFRAFDAVRTAQAPALVNDMLIRKQTPAQGIEVIVGRRQVIVDGAYHALRPLCLPELRAVRWLPAPADPECLEFGLVYPPGRYGSSKPASLRIPVPAAARSAGIRVFEHFRSIIPERKPGLAFRRPRLVIGGGLGVALAAAAVGGAGWMMQAWGDDRSELPVFLQAAGFATAFAALFVVGTVAIIVQPWKKKN